MFPYIDSTDPDPRPKQQPGESIAAFRQRETDWYARRTNPSPASTAAVGMPTPTAKYGGVGGTALGGFRLEPAGALPAPTYMSPAAPAGADAAVASDDFRVSPSEAGSYGPPFSAGLAPEVGAPAVPAFPAPSSTRLGLFGPVGAVAPGMREPRDPTPEELERSRVLTATGFDTEWGIPGDGPGVRWSPTRYLYEPTNDLAGQPYASVTATGRYLQAYRDANGVWRQRWVLATAWAPNPAVPYRTVGDAESRALWSTVNQAALEAQSFDARWKRGEVVRREDPNIVFVPKYGPATRAPRLSDFAWIGQKQLPVGCPYPYPALPVPIADYTSGRWLDADYVPSIPLPPPYDQMPWQCSVPSAPGKPHKGGPPNYTGVENWIAPAKPVDLYVSEPPSPDLGTSGAGPSVVVESDRVRDLQDQTEDLRRQIDSTVDPKRKAGLRAEVARLENLISEERAKPARAPDAPSADDTQYAKPRVGNSQSDRLYDPPKPRPNSPGIPKPTGTVFWDPEPTRQKVPCPPITGPDGEPLVGTSPDSSSEISGQTADAEKLGDLAKATNGAEIDVTKIEVVRDGAGVATPGGPSPKGIALSETWGGVSPKDDPHRMTALVQAPDGSAIKVSAGSMALRGFTTAGAVYPGTDQAAQTGFYIGVKGETNHKYRFAQYISIKSMEYKVSPQGRMTDYIEKETWRRDVTSPLDSHETWYQGQESDAATGTALMFDAPGSKLLRHDFLDPGTARAGIELNLQSGGMSSTDSKGIAKAIESGGAVIVVRQFKTYVVDTSTDDCAKRVVGLLEFTSKTHFDYAKDKRMKEPALSGFQFTPMGSYKVLRGK